MLFKQRLQPNLLQENVQNIIPCVHPLSHGIKNKKNEK